MRTPIVIDEKRDGARRDGGIRFYWDHERHGALMPSINEPLEFILTRPSGPPVRITGTVHAASLHTDAVGIVACYTLYPRHDEVLGAGA